MRIWIRLGSGCSLIQDSNTGFAAWKGCFILLGWIHGSMLGCPKTILAGLNKMKVGQKLG